MPAVKKSNKSAEPKTAPAAKAVLTKGKDKAAPKDKMSKEPARGTKRSRAPEEIAEPAKATKALNGKASKQTIKGAKPPIESEDEDEDSGAGSNIDSSVDEKEPGSGAEYENEEVGDDGESSSDGSDSDGEILHGLSDLSDADSSDEDDAGSVGEITKSGVVKLPSSRDDAAVKSRLDNAHKKRKESGKSVNSIVLYFGRVPKSMPEEPLRAYLTQFGDISRLRLSRNKKTGASKHYAFVEFEDEEVGKIVQETMNNYLLEGRLLQVRILPKEKVHPGLWVGAGRKWRKVPEIRRFRVKHDEPKTEQEKERVQRKLLKRQEQRRQKLKDQGIDYDFEGYVSEDRQDAGR